MMVIIVALLLVTDRVGLKSLFFPRVLFLCHSCQPPITPHPPKKDKSSVLLKFITLLSLNKHVVLCLGCNSSALAAVRAVVLR